MGYSKDDIKLAELFAKRAKADLKSAKDLLKANDFADSVYHSQQCCEKIAKSLLILHRRFVKTHFVSNLLYEILDEINDEKQKKEIEKIIL